MNLILWKYCCGSGEVEVENVTFYEQFAAVFAATDGKNHIEIQRFLLGVGDDPERYSLPVRNIFKHIAAGLRDRNIAPVDSQDLSLSDVAGLKFLSDHLRRCDILPLAALGSCLFAICFEAETRHKQLAQQIKITEMFGTDGFDGDSEWTNDLPSDKIKVQEILQSPKTEWSRPAAADAGTDLGNAHTQETRWRQANGADALQKMKALLRSLFDWSRAKMRRKK